MAEIIWIKGQGEFDFDYLLKLTSRKFVNSLKSRVNDSDVKAVKVFDHVSSISVILVTNYNVRIYDFYKNDKTFGTGSIVRNQGII